MTVNDLQQFIENNLYADVSNEKYNELMGAAENMDLRSFVDTYGDYMAQNSDGWQEFAKKAPKPLQERIRAEFGSSDKTNPFSSKSRKEIDDIYNTYFSDDVPREQFDRNLTAMANFWDDEKNERDYLAGKTEREQEVKDWGWRNLVASDYEKQRYIDDPNKAILGKEAPGLGEAPETRYRALADLGIGAAALGADVGTSFLKTNPITFGIATVTGPAIRGTRDILHRATDSPYKKEWSDIGSNFWDDIKMNASIEGLRNLAQLQRMTKTVSKDPISTVLRNEETVGNLKKQLDSFPGMTELNSWPNDKLFELINKKMADSPFKQALQPYAKDPYHIDRAGIADEIARHRTAVEVFERPEIAGSIKDIANFGDLYSKLNQLPPKLRKEIDELVELGDKMPYEMLVNDKALVTKLLDIPDEKVRFAVASALAQGNLNKMLKFGERQLEKDILFNPSLTRMQLLAKPVWKAVSKFPEKSGGFLKAAADATPEKLDEEYMKPFMRDWYLKNYERDWDMGFRPKKKENDPKWEAFREYYINKYGTEPEEE